MSRQTQLWSPTPRVPKAAANWSMLSSSIKEKREEENEEAVGGLRTPWKAVRKNPKLAVVGKRIRTALEEALDENPEIIDAMLEDHGPSG